MQMWEWRAGLFKWIRFTRRVLRVIPQGYQWYCIIVIHLHPSLMTWDARCHQKWLGGGTSGLFGCFKKYPKDYYWSSICTCAVGNTALHGPTAGLRWPHQTTSARLHPWGGQTARPVLAGRRIFPFVDQVSRSLTSIVCWVTERAAECGCTVTEYSRKKLYAHTHASVWKEKKQK